MGAVLFEEFRFRYHIRPPRFREGDMAFALPASWLQKRHETAMTVSLITNRKLFGEVYSGLQPDYFDAMPPDSGVYVCPLVETTKLQPGVSRPGDIDLLIIPYEGDALILHRIVAMEIKVVRATFAKQGKAPNDMGFSQARALSALGFPYVALAHLIVSDRSPREMWRKMNVARVLDSDGRVEFLPSILADWLPIDLMNRSFGRLVKATSEQTRIGLVAAYLGSDDDEIAKRAKPMWFPATRKAQLNPDTQRSLLTSVADLFTRAPQLFLDNPRYDP